jgi:hypothetical protein
LLEQELKGFGERIRATPFSDLRSLDQHFEQMKLSGRKARFAVVVEPAAPEIRVVIQGQVDTRLVGHHVDFYGFYKSPDETTRDMPEDEYKKYE